jgi:hypothetical protein
MLALNLVLALGLLGSDTARVVAISPRVGERIDAVERRQFNLFPRIAGYQSAMFQQLPDSSYQVEMTSLVNGIEKVETLPLSPARFQHIGFFIDHHDEMIRQLARLPGGEADYQGLWLGICPLPESLPITASAYSRKPTAADRTIDVAFGAALGLGLGGTVGAAAGMRHIGTRMESTLVSACLGGTPHYAYYYVEVYELNQSLYCATAAGGAVAGGLGGYLHGAGRHGRRSTLSVKGPAVAGYDLFSEPITDREVLSRLTPGHQVGGTLLGATVGGVVGVGLGLAVTSIGRAIAFRNARSDSIIVRNGNWAFDVPLIALSLGGLIKGGQLGFKIGWAADYRAALHLIKYERIAAALRKN